MERGHLDMQRLSELLSKASVLPRNEDGMVISAIGVLTIAARSLNDLSDPLNSSDHDAQALREEHDERIEHVQPRAVAYSLETMAKHFEMLREAVAVGDATRVSQFFNLYVFD